MLQRSSSAIMPIHKFQIGTSTWSRRHRRTVLASVDGSSSLIRPLLRPINQRGQVPFASFLSRALIVAAFGLLSPQPPRSVPAYHHKQHLPWHPAGQFLRLLVRRRTARRLPLKPVGRQSRRDADLAVLAGNHRHQAQPPFPHLSWPPPTGSKCWPMRTTRPRPLPNTTTLVSRRRTWPLMWCTCRLPRSKL